MLPTRKKSFQGGIGIFVTISLLQNNIIIENKKMLQKISSVANANSSADKKSVSEMKSTVMENTDTVVIYSKHFLVLTITLCPRTNIHAHASENTCELEVTDVHSIRFI